MKTYIVFGINYHEGRDLLGIYDTLSKATERASKENCLTMYDKVTIEVYLLNSDIQP
jgi:hypothetical protein